MLNQIRARLLRVEASDSAVQETGDGRAFMAVVVDHSQTKLEVGKDCARLTALYGEFNVSCHVVPNIICRDGPCFAIIGPTRDSVAQAVMHHADQVDSDTDELLFDHTRIGSCEF